MLARVVQSTAYTKAILSRLLPFRCNEPFDDWLDLKLMQVALRQARKLLCTFNMANLT